jgi:HlyD family secretion protein
MKYIVLRYNQIQFDSLAARKPNWIPHKFFFAQARARKKILRNDGLGGFIPLILVCFVAGCEPKTETFNGYVEGEYLYIAPTTPSLLQTLSVYRGQQVKEGDDLFALDKTNLKATLASDEAEESQAKANLKDADTEYTRARNLLAASATSQSDYDTRRAAFETAKAALQTAAQKIVQTKKQLVEIAPKAPFGGSIEDTYFHPGEYIAAGTPVVSLLPPENVKIRFFVPEAKLALFPLGAGIIVSCDGCGKPIKAKVNFIASQSEYTPPVIYSVESRDKLVFRVEAQPENFMPVLRPGLPVDVQRDAQ